jgi:hypothetical protein
VIDLKTLSGGCSFRAVFDTDFDENYVKKRVLEYFYLASRGRPMTTASSDGTALTQGEV